jgi:hypothetical protein
MSVSNHNICDQCLPAVDPGSARPRDEVADTGVCGVCLRIAEVFDLQALELYRSHGLSDEQIWRYVPRLRCSFVRNESTRYSLDDLHRIASTMKVV